MSYSGKLKFKKWLNQILEELLWANCHFKVHTQLWPSTEEIANVENRYLDFFQLTRLAHNDLFQLHLSKILDRHGDSMNIFKLIEMIEKQPNLLLDKNLDLSELKNKLSEKEEIFNKLKTIRNKKLAHIDEQFHMSNDLRNSIHLYFGEASILLKDLAEILTDISVAHNGLIPTFETTRITDTTKLLHTLSLYKDEQ